MSTGAAVPKYVPLWKVEIPTFDEWLQRYANQRGGGDWQVLVSNEVQTLRDDKQEVYVGRTIDFLRTLITCLFPEDCDVQVFHENERRGWFQVLVSRNRIGRGGLAMTGGDVVTLDLERLHEWALELAK